MSTKKTTGKKKTSVDKVMKSVSRPLSKVNVDKAVREGITLKVDPTLKEQYDTIRKDILKLREDISSGYDVARKLVEKKGFAKKLFSVK